MNTVGTECEGPGVLLTPDGKFKYTTYGENCCASYNKYGRKLTEAERIEKYKHLNDAIQLGNIHSHYDEFGKKITPAQAKQRDEVDEFFFRNHKNIKATGRYIESKYEPKTWLVKLASRVKSMFKRKI